MPHKISKLIDTLQIQHVIDTLEADITAHEETATALALQNAELHDELQRRLAESESFGRCW